VNDTDRALPIAAAASIAEHLVGSLGMSRRNAGSGIPVDTGKMALIA